MAEKEANEGDIDDDDDDDAVTDDGAGSCTADGVNTGDVEEVVLATFAEDNEADGNCTATEDDDNDADESIRGTLIGGFFGDFCCGGTSLSALAVLDNGSCECECLRLCVTTFSSFTVGLTTLTVLLTIVDGRAAVLAASSAAASVDVAAVGSGKVRLVAPIGGRAVDDVDAAGLSAFIKRLGTTTVVLARR